MKKLLLAATLGAISGLVAHYIGAYMPLFVPSTLLFTSAIYAGRSMSTHKSTMTHPTWH